jgi:hypothetical protein
MKKFICILAAALAVVSVPAAAAPNLFIAPNKAGGLIVLTGGNASCAPGWLEYFMTDSGGEKLGGGCWTVTPTDNTFVHVWKAGEQSERLYPMSAFNATGEK